jgi:hypothetical protein
VEGRGSGTLDAKLAAVERKLASLAADSGRLRRLAGWGWITEALAAAPAQIPAPSWRMGRGPGRVDAVPNGEY